MKSKLTVQSIPIGRINPAPYNPRKDLQPGDPEYEHLARSIDQFGYVDPVVWNKRTGHLVGGHQRFKILLARGATHVDVSVVNITLTKEKALNIALNKVSGDWDRHKLAELLAELARVPDLDLTLTGFDAPDSDALIAGLLGGDGGQDSFDVEAALAAKGPVVTKVGDLILLGREPRTQHRLLCGDSTDSTQVRRLLGGQRAALCATDPPYLVEYTARGHRGQAAVDEPDWDSAAANPELYEKFTRIAVQEALRPGGAWYCWHASRHQAMVEAAWAKAGGLVHQQIIWAKPRGVLTRSWYLWSHEPCLMGWVKGKRPRRRGGVGVAGRHEPMLSTVWQVEGLSGAVDRPDHPTPKPLALFEIPIRQHTLPSEVCYEPFAGSGTQIIAAQRLKRRCHAMELNPRYCDLIVRRFIAMAGDGAVEPKLARKYRVAAKGVAA